MQTQIKVDKYLKPIQDIKKKTAQAHSASQLDTLKPSVRAVSKALDTMVNKNRPLEKRILRNKQQSHHIFTPAMTSP